MTMIIKPTILLLCLIALPSISNARIAGVEEAVMDNNMVDFELQPEQQQQQQEEVHLRRELAEDFFSITDDICNNGSQENPILGQCNTNRFPRCGSKEFICYNRKPSRDEYYPDNHQPKFFIQYDRVLCYPNNFLACSSCTPGRYCKSEERCIMDEKDYPCARWI